MGLILVDLAQMVVSLFVLATSRHREHVADADAAEHTSGRALASAPQRIRSGAQATRAGPASEVSALCIDGARRGLFVTSPPTEKRIARLGGA